MTAGTIKPGGVLMPGSPRPPHHPLAHIFPMLAEARRPSFRASLAEQGQNHPIILHRGHILDGRNRERELYELGKPVAYVIFEGSQRQALDFVIAENLERRDLTDKQRAMIAATIANMKLGDNQHTREAPAIAGPSLPLADGASEDSSDDDKAKLSLTDAAKVMHVSLGSAERAAVIERKGTDELKEAVKSGSVSLLTGATLAELPAAEQKQVAALSEKEILAKAKEIRDRKNKERREERVEKLKKQAAANTPLSTARKFPVIYFDPATKFAAGDSDRSTENHYGTMKEEELAALPIGELATADAVLFMWSTAPWLRKSIRLIEGWGFEYKTNSIWDKETIGLGFWFQNQHEHLIVATRGKMVAPENGSILGRSVYREKKGEHSAKPLYFRDIIDRVPEYRELPKVELFARVDGPMPEGWFAWGNEARVPQQQQLGIEQPQAEAAE